MLMRTMGGFNRIKEGQKFFLMRMILLIRDRLARSLTVASKQIFAMVLTDAWLLKQKLSIIALFSFHTFIIVKGNWKQQPIRIRSLYDRGSYVNKGGKRDCIFIEYRLSKYRCPWQYKESQRANHFSKREFHLRQYEPFDDGGRVWREWQYPV